MICRDLIAIDDVVNELLHKAGENAIVILQGHLAAGKTTLVKAIVKKLGIDDLVTSPTFSLQQCYGERIFHYDIYNHGIENFMSLGLFEEFDKEGLHFVEWGDDRLIELLKKAGSHVVVVHIEKEAQKRCYRIEYA